MTGARSIKIGQLGPRSTGNGKHGCGAQTHYSPFSQVASLISIACGTEDFSAMLNEIGDASGGDGSITDQVQSDSDLTRATCRVYCSQLDYTPCNGLVNEQDIVSVEASLILLGCEGRLTYAEMRVVSNCWSDTIPSVQCAGKLQASRLLKRRGTFQSRVRGGLRRAPFAPTDRLNRLSPRSSLRLAPN